MGLCVGLCDFDKLVTPLYLGALGIDLVHHKVLSELPRPSADAARSSQVEGHTHNCVGVWHCYWTGHRGATTAV